MGIVSRLNRLPLWSLSVGVWGSQMQAPSLDRLVNLWLHRAGLMGKSEKEFIGSLVSPGVNVIDIGANQGIYTLHIARLIDSGRVFAFEPDPYLFRALERNCRRNNSSNIELFNLAAGSTSGKEILFRSLLNSGDNRLASSEHQKWFEPVEVQMAALDDILPDVTVGLIKIDVQGWEYEVLSGMRRLLQRNPAAKIYFEFWPFGLNRAGCPPLRLLEYFDQRSYNMHAPSQPGCPRITDLAGFCRGVKGYSFTNLLAVARGANP